MVNWIQGGIYCLARFISCDHHKQDKEETINWMM